MSMPILSNSPLKSVQNTALAASPASGGGISRKLSSTALNQTRPFKKRALDIAPETELQKPRSSATVDGVGDISTQPPTVEITPMKLAPNENADESLSQQQKPPSEKTVISERLPVTPKKPEEFVFKTPSKSPRILRSPERTPKTPKVVANIGNLMLKGTGHFFESLSVCCAFH